MGQKLVYGNNREEALSNLSKPFTQYAPDSDFKKLEAKQSASLYNETLVFYQAHKYLKEQKKQLEKILESEEDVLILAKDKERLPKYILNKVEVEKMGDTESDDFFKKSKALRVREPTEEQIQNLKTLPLEYLIKRISRADYRRFQYLPEVIDFLNKNLYKTEDSMLYEYIAYQVTIPDKDIFYKSKYEKQLDKLVDELKELEEMSDQEIRRNLKVLTAKHYSELNTNIKQDISNRTELEKIGDREPITTVNQKELGDVM